MAWGEIVRMSLIHQLVICIHVWPYELAGILQGSAVRSRRILEFSKSRVAARTGRGVTRDTRSLGPMDQVVMAGERPSKKIRWGKKTKVTKANQTGSWPRGVRLAPSQERICTRRSQ